MLTIKQNFLETLKKDGHPDRLVKQYEYGAFLPGDPIENYIRGSYYAGMEPKKDAFGTMLIWPADSVAIMPHVTEETKVIKDVTRWQEYVKVPEIAKYVNGEDVWGDFNARVAEVDRNEYMLMPFMHTGLFERLHFLMGFEDLFINLIEEPEAMHELIECIGNYRLEVFKTLIDNVHPDLILSHDDWGSKNSLFIRPEMWREFIKPQYEKLYGYVHDQGIIVVHHADSYLEPIVEDMVDCHVDVWQGVLPSNNIRKILETLDGRMTIQGGLDAAIFDGEETTEEELRAHVRECCEKYAPMGHFIPGITYGGPGTFIPERYDIINEEIDKYSAAHF